VNNRAPTSIDGAWRVIEPAATSNAIPKKIYFEYNRAYMCVFLMPNGAEEWHDFRVDEKEHSLMVSQQWLTPGSEIFKGQWIRDGDHMTLDGSWRGGAPVAVKFEREKMRVKDHQ
jgi:hypothetical protein